MTILFFQHVGLGHCPGISLTYGLSVSPSSCVIRARKGAVCVFSCQRGNFLDGIKTIFCLDQNLWSARVPQCRGMHAYKMYFSLLICVPVIYIENLVVWSNSILRM